MSDGQDRFPRLLYRPPHDAAIRLRDAAIHVSEERLRLLPFNPFDADHTEWWLSPAPDNPAFKYGKIVVKEGRGAAPGDLFVGLFVERGVGRSAAPAFDTARGRRSVMSDDWTWHRVLRALESGAFAESAEAAASDAGVPLTVIVDGGPVSPPTAAWDYNPHGLIEADSVRFVLSGDSLTGLDAELPDGSLAGLPGATSFKELVAAMELIPRPDWVWLDFQIGVRVARAEGAEGVWTSEDLWPRACEPWLSWLD